MIRKFVLSLVVFSAGTAVLLQFGFQKSPAVLKLPIGEWAGEGVYAYEAMPKEAGTGETPVSTTNHYPTRLTIRNEKVKGHDVVVFEILSQHKHVGVLQDDVRARFAYEEAKRLSDAALVYRLVANEMNAAEGSPINYNDTAKVSASLMREGDDLVFTTKYGDTFAESYRFKGAATGTAGEVQKMGLIAAAEKDDYVGFIHWIETLRRK